MSPEQYYAWKMMIVGSVPEDLWPFFDNEDPGIFKAPETPTVAMIREGATRLNQLMDAERSHFFQLQTVYSHEMTRYHRYLAEGAKLRDRILSTISHSKQSELTQQDPVWDWLTTLENSTKPSDAQMADSVKKKHRVLMGAKYTEWPTGGPEKWIVEWLR
jgi:hypothetical protein